MANTTCASTLKAVAMRVMRNASTGRPAVGASNKYVTDSLVLVGHTPVTPDRGRLELFNGNGNQCVLAIDPPKAVESATLNLSLCGLDAELIEILSGGSVITAATDSIGYLAPTDATINPNGVSIEVWTIAQAGRSRALKGGLPAYWRWFWPNTRWQAGEVTLQNDVSVIPLTGVAEPGPGWTTGLTADPVPVTVGDSVYGYFLDTTIPVPSCGYSAVA